MIEKTDLRQDLLKQRRSLSPEAWQAASLQLCQHLQAIPLFQQAHRILAYASFRQEPDLSSLWALPKRWGLPRCQGDTLIWHDWSGRDRLLSGRYGIPEPDPAWPMLWAEAVDLILVPCVACDRQGYRLGYGGGYYDRLFADPQWARIPTIGIVFEFAYLPTLPRDPWDRPLAWVCTDRRSQRCRSCV